MRLLKKEFRLCLHPTCLVMPFLSALVLVPGYPYGVCCFYTALALFFVCLTAREDHDAAYTLTLPVTRRDAVNARVLFSVCVEVIQLIVMGLFILLKALIVPMENPAGLDAGTALIGEGFLIYALFNGIFFPVYYRDILKPGKAFLTASAAMFVFICLEIVATYTVPFVRDRLDTLDPQYLTEKTVFTLIAAALFGLGTYLAARRSAKEFDRVDLSL